MGQFNPFGDGNGSGNVYDNLEAGVNILIEKTIDGKAKISASGEISSEDTVARADIAAIKNGETLDSFGDVELALDNKADLDKVYSKSDVDTALNNKADKSTTYTKTEVDTVLSLKANIADVYSKTDIDAALNNKVDKETGKGLSTNDYTDSEKTKLNSLIEIKTIGTGLNLDNNGELTATGGSGGTTDYDDLSNKPQINGNTLSGNKTSAQLGLASISDIPTTLAELTDDATHRTVSDAEKSVWNAKQNALTTEQLAAVDSGITEDDVTQIETNKNNILYNANQGVKNIFDFDSWYNSLTGATRATITATTNGITLTATGNDSYTMPQINGYHIPVKPNTSYTVTLDSSDSNGQLVFLENDGFSKVYVCETGTKTLTFTTSATADRLSVRFGVPTSGNASTITNIMVQLASISDTTYQPYALSNAELTAGNVDLIDSTYGTAHNVNLDTLTKGGRYLVNGAESSTSNAPFANWQTVDVYESNLDGYTTLTVQIATELGAGLTRKFRRRTYQGGGQYSAWTAWTS